MPTVSVDRDALFARLGRTYTQDDFEKLCFDFGIELDDVAEEAVEAKDGEAATGETKTMYKIEVAANRYDLLCIEGLARSLRVFLELDAAPVRAPCALLASPSGRARLPPCGRPSPLPLVDPVCCLASPLLRRPHRPTPAPRPLAESPSL